MRKGLIKKLQVQDDCLNDSLIIIQTFFMFIIIHLNHFLLDMMSMGKNMIKELLGAFPGIDEAMSFAEVMRYRM